MVEVLRRGKILLEIKKCIKIIKKELCTHTCALSGMKSAARFLARSIPTWSNPSLTEYLINIRL